MKINTIYHIVISILFFIYFFLYNQFNRVTNEIKVLKKQIFILQQDKDLLLNELATKSAIRSIPVETIGSDQSALNLAVDLCYLGLSSLLIGLTLYLILQNSGGLGPSSVSDIPNVIPANASEVVSKVVQNSSTLVDQVLSKSAEHVVIPNPILEECFEIAVSKLSNLSLPIIESSLQGPIQVYLRMRNPEVLALIELKLRAAGFM